MLNGVTVTIDGSDNMVDVMFDVVEEKTLPVTVTTNYLTISDGYILYSTRGVQGYGHSVRPQQ